MSEIETKPFPCVVFKKIKNMGVGGDDQMKETASYWYLNLAQGHRSLDKINQFIRQGNKIVGHQNLDRDYRLKNGQRVKAVSFVEIRQYIDMHTGKAMDPRLADDLPTKADPMTEKIADAKQKQAGK